MPSTRSDRRNLEARHGLLNAWTGNPSTLRHSSIMFHKATDVKKPARRPVSSLPSNELLGGSSSVSSLRSRGLSSSSSVGCGGCSSSSVGCSSVSSSSSWSGCVSSWHGCVSRSDDSSWGFGHWCDWSFFFLSASSQGNSEQGSDQQGFFHGFFLSIYKSRTT